ncbi:SusD/RagB family nutrient-binding outer membrane lipoprotein [Reichenbachiella versicolor]|uniref:SusD/RagB family nutrient-binding outer membrane lipoprotein n=1 Tax=Reichenbachiella versicolor TaxID=1821036 RepID=UPI000D6E3E26|nr:SusD/RagB family nutrient-binding outer membrane lipoprotein [Reichenbachiella versicolor]
MKNILYVFILVLVTIGCDERLDELNTDKKNPSEVPVSTLFASATRELVDNITSTNVNDNPFRLYSQMWAQTTYPQESQYQITTREISLSIFTNQYRDVLSDLSAAKSSILIEKESGESIESDEKLDNKIAVIDILMSYTYVSLVDIFGDVPFTESLDVANLNPKYDDAASIYDAVEATLTTASSTLAANSSEGSFEKEQDLVYAGDLSAWATFANTLKLRMAMKLADVNKAKSIEWADEALDAGVFESNADNFAMTYQGASPNSSPLHEDLVLSGRSDFVLANTLTEAMNDKLDPRLMVYGRNAIPYGWNVDPKTKKARDSVFTTNVIVENYDKDGKLLSTDYLVTPTFLASDSVSKGDIRIFQGGVYGTGNSYGSSSQIGDILHTPTYPGTLLSYVEVEFMMAEMIERGGYNITGTAESHYNTAITASFAEWGVENVATYLARPEVAYTTADGSSGDWKQIIGEQMWLALYNQGLEAWSTWRRFDFEGLKPLPGDTDLTVPNRMTYPLREQTLNSTSYEAAAAAIGGDTQATKVFWDVN